MSCTLFAFMGFMFLMPLLCACLSLICSTLQHNKKVDNVGLVQTFKKIQQGNRAFATKTNTRFK